jgi:Spy/CpxP family protein refolding chaperone
MYKLMLFLFLAVATVAWAQPRHQGMRGEGQKNDMCGNGPMMMHERMIDRLKLTDDQQKQFDKIHGDFQKKQIALRSKIQTMRVDLREMLRADQPDQAAIKSQIGEISKVQTDMKLNHVDLWFAVNKILTTDQQKIWKEMPRRGQMRGRGMFGPRMRRKSGNDDDVGMRFNDSPSLPDDNS